MSAAKFKKVIFKILKSIGWFLLGIILLIIIIVFSLRIPAVQQMVTEKAIKFFKDKTGTEASIGRLYVDFPTAIVLEEVYVEDQKGDTLVYCKYLSADTDLWALLDNSFIIDGLEVENLVGNIHNTETDSVFNFQFIPDALAKPATPQDTVIVDTTSAKPFTFALYEAELNNVRVSYGDYYNGMELFTDVGHLYVDISEFDLNNSKINIQQIKLENSNGKFALLKSAEDDTDTTASAPFYLDGRALLINQVKFTFEDKVGGMRVVTNVGHIDAEIEQLDINEQIYKAQTLAIANSFVSIDQFRVEDTVAVSPDTAASEPLKILTQAKNASLNNVAFRFYDHNYNPVEGFDPYHMWFQQVNADMSDIKFEDGYVNGNISNMSAREKGGMNLKELSAQFGYGAQESYARELTLVTARSNVNGQMSIAYPSLASLQSNPEEVSVDVSFDRSKFDMEDLYYFAPFLRDQIPYLHGANSDMIFQGRIQGTLSELDVPGLYVEGLQSTIAKISGSVTGLPDVNAAVWNVKLSEFETGRKDIMLIVPDTVMPPSMKIPARLAAKGTFEGKINDFKSNIDLTSSMGGVKANLKMSLQPDSLYTYNGQVAVDSFNVGELLGDPQLGKLTMKATVDGKGFSMEDINTAVDGQVSALRYNGYTYQDLSIKGHLKAQQFNGNLAMDDENINFDFEGLVNMNDSIPQYQFTLDLKALDLQALNFSPNDMQVRGRVISDIRTSSIEDINGTLEIKNLVIARDQDVYRIDTFMLAASTNKEITDITIYSRVLDAQFKGNFDLATLPLVLSQHFDRYYSLNDVENVEKLEPQQFDFSINIKRPQFFSEMIVPGLYELRPGPISGTYNSELWALNIDIRMPKVVYMGVGIDSLNIDIRSDEEQLTYETRIGRLETGASAIDNVRFSGIVELDHIKTDLRILDDKGENKYHFGGIFISSPEYYRFQFTPGEFVMNYNAWKVKPSNSLDIYPSGLWVKNLFLNHENQAIKIESTVDSKGDSLLTVDIDNFDLSFLGKLEESSGYLIGGILNGDIDINMRSDKFAFTSDLKVNDFSYRGDTLGIVTLNAYNQGGLKYNMDLDITSNTNNMTVSGYYLADSVPKLNLDANLTNLDLSTVESFSMGQLEDLQGALTGQLKITGTLADPDINGALTFNNTSFRLTYFKSLLTINDESIKFTKKGISFDDFTIKDKNSNTASVDGRVLTKDYVFYEFDMNVNTRNFLMLNTTKEDNELFYGTLALNANARITGTSNQPDIQLNVSPKDGSNVTYVIPESEIQIQEREGIVEFFDKDLEDDPFFKEKEQSTTTDSLSAVLKGLNLSAKIDVNRNSTFSVVIDPVTGDKLTVQGDANLTLGIKPSGDMTLTGRYEVYDGTYNLNFYGLVKREFEIQQGSYLIWTGDPLNARIDITARYEVSAVYQVPGTLNEASTQKAPFIVYLDMKDELLTPDISFRLGLAEGAAASGADSFVAQVNKSENELNTQVFYLLLFKSTKNLDSYSTTGGGNIAESTARNSASKILSNQLNRLAGRIEGVELSLDLQSYNTTGSSSGGTTQLELGLSKQLFNDRVVVKIAGNFGLEGEQARNQQSMSDFAGDIRIEYKLTEDGRFRLVGFRENEYDNLLQGEIIKTGAGVIFVRDYDSFRELFMGKDKDEKEKENQENNDSKK